MLIFHISYLKDVSAIHVVSRRDRRDASGRIQSNNVENELNQSPVSKPVHQQKLHREVHLRLRDEDVLRESHAAPKPLIVLLAVDVTKIPM